MHPCILLNSLLYIMLCDETIEVHCACIHYHSHTYIRHRDIASLLLRHTWSMPKNTPKHPGGFAFMCTSGQPVGCQFKYASSVPLHIHYIKLRDDGENTLS